MGCPARLWRGSAAFAQACVVKDLVDDVRDLDENRRDRPGHKASAASVHRHSARRKPRRGIVGKSQRSQDGLFAIMVRAVGGEKPQRNSVTIDNL
jgi:hypothetical protein